MALHVADLLCAFDTYGWRLGDRCVTILHDHSGEPIDDFNRQCKGHILYRFYGYDGRLLYIGMTKDLYHRCSRGHSQDKSWWKHVAFATVESYPDRISVSQAEASAISREHPFHNVAEAPSFSYHRNGAPGVALWERSPAVFKMADALWQEYLDEEPRRKIPQEFRDPVTYCAPLRDGDGLSNTWLYRPPLRNRFEKVEN